MSEENKNKNVVNLFDMDADDASMGFLEKKSSGRDGIYRPNLKDAKDKSKGYVATIRFLANVGSDMTVGPSAIERVQHYANLPDYSELQGYYDSLVNFGEKCPLNILYWKLKNSKNQAEVERASLIGRSTKFYSYVLILEDEQHPELVGKIMVYPYGYKIKEKINLEKTGEISGKKCNIFDPANGKDFRIFIREIGGFNNYDNCSFREVSPISIFDEATGSFHVAKTEWSDDQNKFVINNPKVQTKVFEFLTKRGDGVNLDEHQPTPWTEEIKVKIEKVIEVLSGKDISGANRQISENSTSTTSTDNLTESSLDESGSDDLDDFFGEMED